MLCGITWGSSCPKWPFSHQTPLIEGPSRNSLTWELKFGDGALPNYKKLSNVPWGVGKLQRPYFWGGLWGWWWGVKHAKMHIGSTGPSYLVGSCSWQSQADIGTWHCTGPKGVQIVGFLNGTCAGLMWTWRALWLVVQKTLPISPGAL